MNYRRLLVITSIVTLCALSPSAHGLSGPAVEQVKRDLVGQTFVDHDRGQSFEIVAVGGLLIKDRLTDSDAKTEDLHVSVDVTVRFAGYPYTARGVLAVHYKHFDQGWRIQSVSAERGFTYTSPTASVAPSDGAADSYKTTCAPCHGPDGSGQTGLGKVLKLRDLRSADVQQQSDSEIQTIISDGKGKMPSYGAKMNAADISALVAFVRRLAKH
ncbi:MAG TPA: cytochrome c [Thermoanaerobaculia bacterium]|jgi:cytochrome c553|nr:cytochrome c [Thermoanaerobaculia bacterium]